MSNPKPAYYITTPIYYVNDIPHLGHTYTSVACDVLARFNRLDGYDVKFLTGTDEHGLKVLQAAQKAGRDPQAHTDIVSQNFRNLSSLMNLSNDDFIRTTEDRHKKGVQHFWSLLVESGDIYLDKYAGWYAVRDEAYYSEDELKDGPDGTKIAPSGAPCEWFEEESYFFKLSAWEERLLDFYEKNPDFILPKSRRNEVISFVKSGLKDLSVSRTTFNWGVPVPNDDKHVMYVWIDALCNYITALGYPDEKGEFSTYWPADVHMVGKDILRFHAVYWPAFLMAAGLQPPKRVFAHGWWTIEGQKMSKSLGNVICPGDLVETYGLDQSRYFLLREVPFGNDGDFAHAAAIARINSDLANAYGNLVQRTLSMIAKNCDGMVPEHGPFTEADRDLLDQAGLFMLDRVRQELSVQAFNKALDVIWSVISAANSYIDEQAPWALKKTDPERMKTVLYVLAETIRHLGLITQPFMPNASSKILDQLSVPQDERTLDKLTEDYALKPGVSLPKPTGVFPRIVEEEQRETA